MKIGIRIIDKKTGLPKSGVVSFNIIFALSMMAMVVAITTLCSMDMGNGKNVLMAITTSILGE